jgi:two-component system sensor histidine kinase DegS
VFDGPRLPLRVELALYRIVQEALNNVSKHARATVVKIRLRRTGKEAVCSVDDNGVGFDPDTVNKGPRPHGSGLLGIQERLQALQGKVHIQSLPGKGTKLKIVVPLEG